MKEINRYFYLEKLIKTAGIHYFLLNENSLDF